MSDLLLIIFVVIVFFGVIAGGQISIHCQYNRENVNLEQLEQNSFVASETFQSINFSDQFSRTDLKSSGLVYMKMGTTETRSMNQCSMSRNQKVLPERSKALQKILEEAPKDKTLFRPKNIREQEDGKKKLEDKVELGNSKGTNSESVYKSTHTDDNK